MRYDSKISGEGEFCFFCFISHETDGQLTIASGEISRTNCRPTEAADEIVRTSGSVRLRVYFALPYAIQSA
jgi:hypothetical protein